ncbi:MAG: cbb3-type cytochrome c oxidase subunit I [Ilumatobacteraceae bacterium]
MTTIESSPDAVGATRGESAAGSFVASVAAWLTTTDHKRIGQLLVSGSLLGLAATAVIGVLLGIERVDGGDVLLDADAIPQLFQLHRVGLVFAILIPLGIGLSIAVVPLQLGARALAFPRLALVGFYGWLAGLVLVIVALAGNGGIGGGDSDMVDLFLAAHVLMALGLIAAAGSIATSVLTTRAPGMSMRRVPLFSWAALVTAIGVLLALPVLIGAVVYLFVDHRNARAVFGGSEGIGNWLGWVFTQPVSYVFALPAVGVAAELFPVTFGRRQVMRGVVYAGLALVGVSALSGVTQQNLHTLPWPGSGLDTGDLGTKFDDFVPFAMFNLLPVLGLLIVIALGALTAKGARPSISSPFVFGFLGTGMVLAGMLGGVLYPIDDLGLQGTVFEEGAHVYVVYGAVLGMMGGVVYWAPKLWGRAFPEPAVMGLAGLGLIATVLASLPYYVAGFADQPGASPVYDYSGPAELWNALVLVGHVLMLLTVLAFAGLAVKALSGDSAAPDDPWDAHTVEWTTTSPAPFDNYAEVPVLASAEPALDRKSAEPDT